MMKKFATQLTLSEVADLTRTSVAAVERNIDGDQDLYLRGGCYVDVVENTDGYALLHDVLVTQPRGTAEADEDLALLRSHGAQVTEINDRHPIWDADAKSCYDDAFENWKERQFFAWESNDSHIDAYLDTLSGADYARYLDNLWEGHNATT